MSRVAAQQTLSVTAPDSTRAPALSREVFGVLTLFSLPYFLSPNPGTGNTGFPVAICGG